jgi:hypothetical protein
MSEPRMLDATVDEMANIAKSRTLALGRPCAVASFTGSGRAHVVDFDDDGEVAAAWSVPLMHPSPGVADRLPPSREADE